MHKGRQNKGRAGKHLFGNRQKAKQEETWHSARVESADGRTAIEGMPLPFHCPAIEESVAVLPEKLKVLLLGQIYLVGILHAHCNIEFSLSG